MARKSRHDGVVAGNQLKVLPRPPTPMPKSGTGTLVSK